MPKNYFLNRPESSRCPEKLNIGDIVFIIEKEKQGTKNKYDLVKGEIISILSKKGNRYENGAKVKIVLTEDDIRYEKEGAKEYIGRVQYIAKRRGF